MADKAASVHAPVRFIQIHGGQHAHALITHACKTGLNVARPLGIAVPLSAQIEVPIQ
jgi:hypothetical protein